LFVQSGDKGKEEIKAADAWHAVEEVLPNHAKKKRPRGREDFEGVCVGHCKKKEEGAKKKNPLATGCSCFPKEE